MLKSFFAACVAVSALACSDETPVGAPGPNEPAKKSVANTRGSAIVLTRDETVAVTANRTAGAITILRLDPTREPSEVMLDDSRVEYDAGEGSEPWSAVIGADDDTAYVVLRGRGAVQRVKNLHGTPVFSGRVQVGSEPTAISISPSGAYLFVANWGDGTLSTIPIGRFDEPEANGIYVDFNRKLADTGLLGSVESRPALAHPRALAMTSSGDDVDSDETLYLTEFFSQPLENVVTDPEHHFVDQNRQGLVYSFPVSGAGFMAAPVTKIPPVVSTGFADANASMTGCFPNQLYAAALGGPTLFVTAMCTSPRGPVGAANAKTAVHPAIFLLDTATNALLPPVVLTDVLRRAYEADKAETDAGGLPASEIRMPLIPNDIAVGAHATRADARSAYITALGADAVFRVDFANDGSFIDVGSPQARYIDLRPEGGTLPIGIALSSIAERPFALVLGDNNHNVTVIDRTNDALADAVSTTGKDPETDEPTRPNSVLLTLENTGRRVFATGLDVWSQEGQAWSSCEACHPDGLSDGVTWFFSRGPRRTISTASTYDKGSPSKRRILLWTANVDEIQDVEVITRTVSGGIGGIVWDYHPNTDCRLVYDGKGCATDSPSGTCVLTGNGSEECGAPKHTTTLHNGLNGALSSLFVEQPDCEAGVPACDEVKAHEWNYIDAYIQSVRVPQKPPESVLLFPEVSRGLALFRNGRCAACHGGPGWTISKLFYEPGAATNGALPYVRPTTGVLDLIGTLRTTTYEPPAGFPRALNPPSLNGPALLRSFAPADPSDAAAIQCAYDTCSASDQINCALRAVGTFPPQAADVPTIDGIVASGAPPVLELKDDMKTLALGASGFNVPSLLGLATRAPYYHAGNARTLEEAFDPVFRAHYQAMVPGFLDDSEDRAADVQALVHFLLSIDESTPLEAIPSDQLGFEPVLCPTLTE